MGTVVPTCEPEWAKREGQPPKTVLFLFGTMLAAYRAMHHSSVLSLLALLALTGCLEVQADPAPLPAADGGPVIPDTPTYECTEAIDSVCPDEGQLPLPGAACLDGLECEVPTTNRGFQGGWRLACETGAWRYVERPTGVNPPHNEQPLPPAEICRDPFEGTRPDSPVLVGPAGMDGFRQYEADERVRLTRGGQGAYMLEFRVDLPTGRDLNCLTIEASVTLAGRAAGEAIMQVETHCGRTRRMYLIVDPPECDYDAQESRDYPLTIHLHAPGLGQSTFPLILEHGPCEFG